MKKAPSKFNKKMKAAAAAGELDKNPKLKAAVEAAPTKMKKAAMKLKKSGMMMKKAATMMKKASAMKMKMKAAAKMKKK